MLDYPYNRVIAACGLVLLGLCTKPASGQLLIQASFNTDDPGSTVLTGAQQVIVNQAIAVYEATFTNPVTIKINFDNMASGLGMSTWSYINEPYATYISTLRANAVTTGNPDQLTAISLLPQATNNPITGDAGINVKISNLVGLGLYSGSANTGLLGNVDGYIGLNTSLTGAGPTKYSLLAVTEHEIDEVLGLGSSSGSGNGTFLNNDPLPEDLYRYSSNGALNFSINPAVAAGLGNAYFSINGTTDLAQFNNQSNGADWGDWQSNPLPNGVNPQVQDAFGSPGSTPTLGVNEIAALNVLGWNLSSATVPNGTPEPGTAGLLVSVSAAGIGAGLRRKTRSK